MYIWAVLKKFRNNVFIKILFGFLGFHLLNISIDIPKITPIKQFEELSFNNQESIVGFFLEKILGCENTLEKYENSSDDFKQNKNFDFELIAAKGSFFNIKLLPTKLSKQKFSELVQQLTSEHQELDTPPPKV